MNYKSLIILILLLAFIGCSEDKGSSDEAMMQPDAGQADPEMQDEMGPQAGTGMQAEMEPQGEMEGEAGTMVPSTSSTGGNAGADPPEDKKDIIDTALEAGGFSTLAAAITAADLIDALKADGPFTVFAPNDEAFAALGTTVNDLLLPENKDQLVAILTYHVVSSESPIYSTDLTDGALVATLGGPSLSVDLSGALPLINDAEVISTDIEASNGVIHVLNKVILPPEDDIVQTAINTENQFTKLEAALVAANLVDALKAEGPFTVFAPTDAAFEALGTTLDDLLKPENLDQLTEILKYHVINGSVGAADISNGLQVDTLSQGKKVTFDLTEEKPKVNDAKIVATNILATNGVIHVIDKVITPSE